MAFCYRHSFWFLTPVTFSCCTVSCTICSKRSWTVIHPFTFVSVHYWSQQHMQDEIYYVHAHLSLKSLCKITTWGEKGAKKMTACMLFLSCPSSTGKLTVNICVKWWQAGVMAFFFLLKLTQYSVIILLLNTEILASSVISVTDSTTPETLPSIFHFCSAC